MTDIIMGDTARLLLFFAFSFAFSYYSNIVFLKFIKSPGIRKNGNSQERWATSSKPATGGLTFYLVFLLSSVFSFFFIHDGNEVPGSSYTGLLASGSLAFLMGIADDAYGTKPMLKFVTQVICGIIMIMTGTVIHFFNYELLNFLLTVLWVAGMMNSINMIDNMDGLAGGISISILLAIILIMVFSGLSGDIHLILFVSLVASLIAFLKYNLHPSTIYMGDTGSQFLGNLLAYGGIHYLWNFDCGTDASDFIPALAVALIYIIPLSDTFTVSWNRILSGSSPVIGGKDHTSHHLSRLGFSDNKVFLIFTLTAMFSSFIGILLLLSDFFYGLFLTAPLLIGLVIFGILLSVTRIGIKK
ncbi:MAG: undecaprenyl/decaprenyl-phosphate alpha-N-acetylglucosaminyl 1-phosphate transferase [Bacteroidetes bacterium]|nr:undecaprenyl/decaprenyl-phosphate alpha-N-acetylglucosaminyl 1-phosphate transferase [Bacteroidota bacterium]